MSNAARARTPALPSLVVAVASVVEVYAFVSSLFGDGFIDVGRHALPGQLAFVVVLGATAVWLWRSGKRIASAPLARSA